MHTVDKSKAIKYLRAIADAANGAIEVLTGNREPRHVTATDDHELLETVSQIEACIDSIESLGLWSDGGVDKSAGAATPAANPAAKVRP